MFRERPVAATTLLSRTGVPVLAGLLALCVASAATTVTLGTHLTFFNDDWYFLLQRPGLGVDTLLEPHNGHLSLLPVLVYKGLAAGFGLDAQLPFRLVLAATICGLCVLVFAYVRERAGDLVALLAALSLAFLGPAWEDLLWSFQIGLVGSLVGGLGAILALERDSRRGDRAACLLLVASIGCSNLGLSFIAAATTVVALRRRPAQAWIPAVPAALFAAWWAAYGSTATGISLANVARAPAYVLDAVASALASLSGLGPRPGGGVDLLAVGRPLLALAAVGVGAWLLRGNRPGPGVLPLLVAALVFWGLLAANFIPNWREADTSRYQLVSATFLVMIGAELFRPLRVSPRGLAIAAALVLVAVVANLAALREGYGFFRSESAIARADLTALEIGRARISPDLRLVSPVGGSPYVSGISAGRYYAERDEHGTPAYSEAELADAPAAAQRAADSVLGTAYGLHLVPLRLDRGRCAGATAVPPGRAVPVPAGGAALDNDGTKPVELVLLRFSEDGSPVILDALEPGRAAALRIPLDRSRRPWRLRAGGEGELALCPLPTRPGPRGGS